MPLSVLCIRFRVNKNCQPEVVGYATLYQFLHFPDKIRVRLSQFLMLPGFQGKQLGSVLYQSILKKIVLPNDSIIEITGNNYSCFHSFDSYKLKIRMRNFRDFDSKIISYWPILWDSIILMCLRVIRGDPDSS